MNIKDYLQSNRIVFDVKGNTKEEILKNLSELFLNDSSIIDKDDEDKLLHGLMQREQISSTGMQDGIAIPHVKAGYIKKVSVSLGISKEGKEFDSIDGKPSTLIFVILAPLNENRTFMKLLSNIASLSTEEEHIQHILNLENKEEILNYLASIGNEYE